MGGEGRCHDLRLTVRRDTRQPEKNNPSCHSPLAKDKLTKILVRSEQYCPFLIGQVQDDIIGNPRLHFSHIPDLMAAVAQPHHNRTVHSFIGHDLHAGTFRG